MPISLILNPGKGGRTKKSLPSFFYRSKEERINRLREFLNMVEKAAYLYETEDLEAGEQYFESFKDKASLENALENATPELTEMIEASREKLGDPETLKLLLKSAEIQPSGGGVSENNLMLAPVGDFEVDLNQFAGRLNTKKASNLWKKLSEDLSESEFEQVFDEGPSEDEYKRVPGLKSEIDGDKMIVEAPNDTWEAVVDEDKFKEATEFRGIDAPDVAAKFKPGKIRVKNGKINVADFKKAVAEEIKRRSC